MPKSAILLVLGAGVVALAVVVGATHDDAPRKSTLPAPVETQQSIAESTKAATAEAVREPLLPSPAPLPSVAAPSPRTLAEPPAPEPLDENR